MKKRDANITAYELDLNNPPPLSPKQQDMLNNLASMPDSVIDYSDISHYKPNKQITTIRIDTDIIYWLKSLGNGYQSKINAILRREMISSKQNAS